MLASKVKWLKQRDLNISFFYMVASGWHRASLISPAMLSIPESASVGSIRRVVLDVFMLRYSGSSDINIAI